MNGKVDVWGPPKLPINRYMFLVEARGALSPTATKVVINDIQFKDTAGTAITPIEVLTPVFTTAPAATEKPANWATVKNALANGSTEYDEGVAVIEKQDPVTDADWTRFILAVPLSKVVGTITIYLGGGDAGELPKGIDVYQILSDGDGSAYAGSGRKMEGLLHLAQWRMSADPADVVVEYPNDVQVLQAWKWHGFPHTEDTLLQTTGQHPLP